MVRPTVTHQCAVTSYPHNQARSQKNVSGGGGSAPGNVGAGVDVVRLRRGAVAPPSIGPGNMA